MSALQVMPVPAGAGVESAGHYIEALNYCHLCQLYFVNANACNIHRHLYSIKIDLVCLLCNGRFFELGHLAQHLIQMHRDKQQPEAAPNTVSSIDDRTLSKRSNNSK